MEGAPVKIALAIPCHGDTKSKFTQCLAEMLIHTMGATFEMDGKRIQPEIETFMVSCSLLTESRNRLVAEAINWEADYMLWMDADHVFPRDALVKLLSHNLPVVGCNYARRFSPTAPTASVENEEGKLELVWSPREGVSEVAHMGLGFCLMDMRVFAAMDKHYGGNFWPLFVIEPSSNGITSIGEDVYFFKKIREAGIPIHCDHELSWDVGHIAETILTQAHCVKDRERWVEFNNRKMDKFKREPA
jgi:hypothetical protein